ncbi:MAG: hypothetical protein AAF961_16535, partial [Planctomycetota bacterium]
MSATSHYQLIDFGNGRKLERVGPWLLDRPCPAAAETRCASPDLWRDATACYQGRRAGEGKWTPNTKGWRPATVELAVELQR